jgi:hypothetical protein
MTGPARSPAPARKLLVYYPSGKAVKVTGAWLGPVNVLGKGHVDGVGIDLTAPVDLGAGQRLAAGEVLLCDPRCVVVDRVDLSVVYHPRLPTAEITDPLQATMRPDWPDTAFRAIAALKRRRL